MVPSRPTWAFLLRPGRGVGMGMGAKGSGKEWLFAEDSSGIFSTALRGNQNNSPHHLLHAY